jgi:hypothetical protein
MKTIKHIFGLVLMSLFMVSFSQCSSSKQIMDEAPIALEQVYCESWIAGIEGGGSGLNIFIPTSNKTVVLDSVYFRGKAAKLEINSAKKMLYVGRFTSEINSKKDIVMSNEPHDEYGNNTPQIDQKIPFELEDNQCVISYIENNKTKYFRVDNVIEKESIPIPSAPTIKQ